MLTVLLANYPLKDVAAYLLDGFQLGFHIPVLRRLKATFANNLKSVQGMEEIVRQNIEKEVREDRVLGLFVQPPVLHLRVSS